jgi:hypothetical protein
MQASLTFRHEVQDHFPISPREFFELSAHSIVTTVHFQYQIDGRMVLPSRKG